MSPMLGGWTGAQANRSGFLGIREPFPSPTRLALRYTADADRTSDHYLAANLRTCQSLAWLVRDDVARAARDIEGILDGWPSDVYQVQHFFHLLCPLRARALRGAARDGVSGRARRPRGLCSTCCRG
jgi:hypothetical protein